MSKLQYRIKETVTYFETGNVETNVFNFETKGQAIEWLGTMKTAMNHCKLVDQTRTILIMKASSRQYHWHIEEYTDTEDELRQSIQIARETVEDLVRYLNSSKFNEDTTVQVQDVLRRLQPVRSELASETWI